MPVASSSHSAAVPAFGVTIAGSLQVAGQWGKNIAGQYTSAGVVSEAVEGAVSGAVNNAGGYWFNAERR